MTSHSAVNSNQAVSRTAISRDKGQGEECGGVEGEMEKREVGMKRGGGGQRVLVAPKGEGPEQLTSVCARVCVQHWGGGKWECEREAGRVGPAAPHGSS